MTYLPSEGYKRILVISAYIILGTAALYVALKYLLRPFLPFLLAWLTAMMLRPIISFISKNTRAPRKFIAFVCVLIVLVITFGLIGFICGRAAAELRSLAENLVSDVGDAAGDLFDYTEKLAEKFPFLESIEDKVTADHFRNAIVGMIENAVTAFSAKIPGIIMNFASALPGIILFAIALVVATFYLTADVGNVNAFIAIQLPEKSRKHLFDAKKKLMSAGIKYVRAYIIILFITFAQLLTGFLILKIEYSLTLAALIAVIDILPIFGVGTVLVPWAVILLIRGDTYNGVGLLIVFGVIWLVRQIIEPRIVGQSIGLPPLVTLIAMYAGYKFMGFAGLFVLPLMLILIKNLNDVGVIHLWKELTDKNPHLFKVA